MNSDMSIMQRFADPELFATLTGGEKALGALTTTLLGMGITFLVLVLLWAIIVLMGKIAAPKAAPAGAGGGEIAVIQAPAAQPAAGGSAAASEGGVSPETAAVIAAAIEAFEGSASPGSSLIIRRISRVSGAVTPWRSAGSAEVIESRRF